MSNVNEAVAQKVRGVAEVALQRMSLVWGSEFPKGCPEDKVAKELARILISIGDTFQTEAGAKDYWKLFCKHYEKALRSEEERRGYVMYKCSVEATWENAK